ncbi:hypothetical protein ACFL0H_10085 [Thermodesulfobacteriota bacterium]
MSHTNVYFKFILLITAPALVVFFAFAGPAFSYELFDWETGAAGYEIALMDAEDDEKPLVLFFHIGSSVWNTKMKDEYLGAEEVEKFLRDIPKVEINPDREETEKLLSANFKVEQYPAFFVFIPSFKGKPQRIHPFGKKDMTAGEFLERVKAVIVYQYNEKGVSYFQKKDYKNVLKYLEISMEYDSNKAYTFYAMGVVYNSMAAEANDMELLKKAEENYQRALKIDPNHKESMEALKKLQKK